MKSKVRNIAGRQRREALAASSTYDILGREDGGVVDIIGLEKDGRKSATYSGMRMISSVVGKHRCKNP